MQSTAGLSELQNIASNFSCQFMNAGFRVEPEVSLNSSVDSSVRLIGAPISVLKPYLGDETLDSSGVVLVQNCIRTHNLRNLFEVDAPQGYGSFFTGLGALASSKHVDLLFHETSNFLFDNFAFDDSEAFISVFGGDKDLSTAAGKNGRYEVRPNVMEPDYYRHGYGMQGVYGRNTSYWVKNRASGEYEDIGNVIIIENDNGAALGAEIAFGDTTLLKQSKGLDHVTTAYNLRLVEPEADMNLRTRLEDCVITSMALASEGLTPGARSNQTRILRSYIKGLSLFRRLCNLDTSYLGEKLELYEEGYFPFNAKGAGRVVLASTIRYENSIAELGASNKEDLKVLSLLEECTKK